MSPIDHCSPSHITVRPDSYSIPEIWIIWSVVFPHFSAIVIFSIVVAIHKILHYFPLPKAVPFFINDTNRTHFPTSLSAENPSDCVILPFEHNSHEVHELGGI